MIEEFSNMNFLKKSEIRNMSVECDKVNGINLSQGICDFPLEKVLYDNVSVAMNNGINHYTDHTGLKCLKESVANKLKKYNGLCVDAEKNVLITSGSTGAFYCACHALLNKGDEVIIFEPFYGYHEYTLLSLGIVPIYIKLKFPDFSIDFNDIEKSITKKTKAIIINTPSNPCGKVFSKHEIDHLADLCEKYNLLVFTDEIYEYILYDGMKHISPATHKKLSPRTVTISGYSKTFSITGWRIGYCVADENILERIGYSSDLIYVCAPAPFQYAVSKAIDILPDIYYENLSEKFTSKRNLICNVLEKIGLHPFIPHGAYYVMCDISALKGDGAKEKCMWLLEKTGISLVPGTAFFNEKSMDGNSLARLCYAKTNDVLQEACDRLMKLKI